ncbi:MAG: hypothetical protein ACK44A_03180 [Roseateles sp.]
MSPTRIHIAAAQPALVPADSIKGRGTATAMPHRFEARQREQFDDGWGSLDQLAAEEHLPPATEVIEEQAGKMISSNQSPDISFDYSINPYRGCEHVMWNSPS